MTVHLPNDTQRAAIIGRTGSGKTVAGVRMLAEANYTDMPYIVYDFKRDTLLADIAALDGAHELAVTSPPPKTPGIYFVHPNPNQKQEVEDQMWKVWEQNYTGVFVDEGYMICGGTSLSPAYRAILTQGRSKHIPAITLSQRPAWIDRFVFSEADYFQVFALTHNADRAKVEEYVHVDLSKPLPKYHSYYHDVAEEKTVVMKPVPTDDKILAVFSRRLATLKKKPPRVRAI